MKKRFLSCFLAVTMTIGLFTVPAAAASEDYEMIGAQAYEEEAEAAAAPETPENPETTEIQEEIQKAETENKDTEEVFELSDEVTGWPVVQDSRYAVAAAAEGECPTPEEAYQRMIAMKEQYPEGMRWTNENYYAWNGGGRYGGGYGCAGFAMLLSDAAFGTLPSREMTNVTIEDLHPGDFLRVNNDTHSVMIMEVYSDYVVLAEGNYNSSIHWGRIMNAQQVAAADYVTTRYPLGYFNEYNKVIFDSNGGYTDTYETGAKTNALVTIPDAVPLRHGYTFAGWAATPTAKTAIYQPGDSFVPTGNTTLYAVWKAKKLPTIETFPAVVNGAVAAETGAEYILKPDEDAVFKIESRSSADTIAFLYDQDGSQVAFDDDSGESGNFRIETNLKAGNTYILVVQFYNKEQEGEIPFAVSRTVINRLTGPFPKNLKITIDEYNFEVIYFFTPDATGDYTFEAAGSIDSNIFILNEEEGSMVAEDDDSGENLNFLATAHLKANVLYSIHFSSFNYKTGSYDVNITGGGGTAAGVRIVSQPVDASAAVGDKISFTVTAENAAAYQWQYSKDGVTWTNSTVTSAKTRKVNLTVSKTNCFNIYRCRVTGENGSEVYSSTAGIALIPWAEITSQPESPAMINGETVQFRCEAENADAYQWQYSKDGITWKNSTLSSAKTNTLSIKVSDTNSMNIYRCMVTGMDGATVASDKAVFVLLTRQPEPCSAPLGTKASYTIKAENAASYQWQYSKDGGLTWHNSTLTSAKTDTLTFTVALANQENLYRCRMKTTTGVYAYTKPVGYVDALKIVTQPTAKTAAAGKTVYFKVEATGKDLSYQWQYSKDGGKTWTNSTLSTATTASLKVTAQTAQNGRLFRCVITDGRGQKVTSNSAKLTVN